MSWDWYWGQIFFNLLSAIPWLVGGLGAVAIISLSPLGRALLRHLKERREETALLEELLTQVSAMRQELAEATERLDGTDRMLRSLQSPVAPRAQLAPPAAPSPPAVTPH